jgi:hypothetical protein
LRSRPLSSPLSCIPFGRSGVLVVTLRNKSPVEVVVPAIYVASSNRAGFRKSISSSSWRRARLLPERPVLTLFGEPDEVVVVRSPYT